MSTDTQQEYRRRSGLDHAWHVWINERQEQRAPGEPWERDLYEWKTALYEVERLPYWLKQARTGTLRTVHQQCSHSAPEGITENRLICALGVDVTACPILQSLYASFAQEVERDQRMASEKFPARFTDDDGDILAARTCAWHIFMASLKGHVDTSEGYVQDESDRRYWHNVYTSLDGGDPDGDGEPIAVEIPV